MKAFKKCFAAIFLTLLIACPCLALTNYICHTASSHSCTGLATDQCGAQGGGKCTYCAGTTPLPNKVCVAAEGFTCAENSNSYNCGPRSVGDCYRPNQTSAWTCINKTANGQCSSVRGC